MFNNSEVAVLKEGFSPPFLWNLMVDILLNYT